MTEPIEIPIVVPGAAEAVRVLGDFKKSLLDAQKAIDSQIAGSKPWRDSISQRIALEKQLAATQKIETDTLKALTAETDKAAKSSKELADSQKKSLSGSDLAKAVFSDDLVRRVENFGGVAVEASGSLSKFSAIGLGVAGMFAAVVSVGIEANNAIEEHKQEVAAALAETTKYTERVEGMAKAMDGSASSARAMGVAVSDTATRQEVQTAVVNNQSRAYIALGASIDEAIKKAAEAKRESEQSSEGTKSVGVGIVKAAVGPIAEVVSYAGAAVGKLKTLSAEYRDEQAQKAQAAAYQEMRSWEISIAQTKEQLKQLGIAREKAAIDAQALLQRLSDLGIQSALGEKLLTTDEQLAASSARISEEQQRRNALLAEQKNAAEAYKESQASVLQGTVLAGRTTKEFQESEASRQEKILEIEQKIRTEESRRAEITARRIQEDNSALQMKLQADALADQLAKRGIALNLGQQALSQQDRVAAVQAQINELQKQYGTDWEKIPKEIQKSLLVLGGMLNAEAEALKPVTEAHKERAKHSGQSAANSEHSRAQAQLELQILNEQNIALGRFHNASIARLDIADKIHKTEEAILALNLSGERIRQRDLDKAKDLTAQLERLKQAQLDIRNAAASAFENAKLPTRSGTDYLAEQREAEKKLNEMRGAHAIEHAGQLNAALEAQREGNRLTVEQNNALLNRESILNAVAEEQKRNTEELARARAQLGDAITPSDQVAAAQRVNDLERTSMHLLQLKDSLNEAQKSADTVNFEKVNRELEKLVQSGDGMERVGASIRLGMRTAFGPENARLADQSSELITGALGGIESGFKQVAQAIIEGKDIGPALAAQGKTILTNLALEASWKAAMAFATGLFQLATYQYPQAASSFAAGAAFAGVAALGGIAAAAIPSPPSTSASANPNAGAGGGRVPPSNNSSNGEGGAVTNIINYNGTSFTTSSEMEQFLGRGMAQLGRNNNVPRAFSAGVFRTQGM